MSTRRKPSAAVAAREATLTDTAVGRLESRVREAISNHPDAWAEGLQWYPRESARLEGLALALRVPHGLLKAAAAVLSPGNSWSVLLEMLPGFAREVAKRKVAVVPPSPVWPPAFPTYSENRWKAARLLLGTGIPADEVSGRKVWPFYAALSGDRTAVVLDRHSSRHALGKEHLTTVEHRAAVAAFRIVAERWELHARDLQAALWTVDVGAGGDVGGARAKSGGRNLDLD